MTSVAVIGGGVAGLSAAARLAGDGLSVTLFESSRHLGGRARSFPDPVTGDTVDNGQHLLMRCYEETLDYLRLIGAAHKIVFQDRLSIPFVGPSGERSCLSPSRWLPGSAGLAWGLWRLPEVRLSDLMGLRRMVKDLRVPPPHRTSVDSFLNHYGQSPGVRTRFWNPLCLAALNLSPEHAPARHLAAILRMAFTGSSNASALGYPGVGLSSLFAEQAHRFLEERRTRVLLGCPVVSVAVGPPDRLQLRTGEVEEFDTCLIAVPPPALARLVAPKDLGDAAEAVSQATPSPILSVNLWFERPVAQLESVPFIGLLGARMHFVFNKPLLYAGRDAASAGHVTVVTSAADDLVGLDDDALQETALEDLRNAVAGELPPLVHSLIVREHRATYGFPDLTPPPPGPLPSGLHLAGDWTDTGLPCTIEGAVLSGRLAAAAILQN